MSNFIFFSFIFFFIFIAPFKIRADQISNYKKSCIGLFNSTKNSSYDTKRIDDFILSLSQDTFRLNFENKFSEFKSIGDYLIESDQLHKIPELIEAFLSYAKKYTTQPKDNEELMLKDYFRVSEELFQESNFNIFEIESYSNQNVKVLISKTNVKFGKKDTNLLNIFVLSPGESSYESNYFVEAISRLNKINQNILDSNGITDSSSNKISNLDKYLIGYRHVGDYELTRYFNADKSVNIYQQHGGTKRLYSQIAYRVFYNIYNKNENSSFKDNSIISEFENIYREEENTNLLTYGTLVINDKSEFNNLNNVFDKFKLLFSSLESRQNLNKTQDNTSNFKNIVTSIQSEFGDLFNEPNQYKTLDLAERIGFKIRDIRFTIRGLIQRLNSSRRELKLSSLLNSLFNKNENTNLYDERIFKNFERKLNDYVIQKSNGQFQSYNSIQNESLMKKYLNLFTLEMLAQGSGIEDGLLSQYMKKSETLTEVDFQSHLNQFVIGLGYNYNIQVFTKLDKGLLFKIDEDTGNLIVIGYSNFLKTPIETIEFVQMINGVPSSKTLPKAKQIKIISPLYINEHNVPETPLIFIAEYEKT